MAEIKTSKEAWFEGSLFLPFCLNANLGRTYLLKSQLARDLQVETKAMQRYGQACLA